MSSNVVRLCLREIEFYRHVSRIERNPVSLAWYLRRCADDLEEAVVLLEELSEDHPDQLELPLGWQIIEGGEQTKSS